MFTSIKRSVLIRIGASVLATLLFCIVVLANVSLIKRANASTENANNLLSRAYGAESAHYRWASNLSNALYAGAEFTGSLDYTSCALGQWLYGEEELKDAAIESLRSQIEPLHKELHASAGTALELYANDKVQAQQYYQETILPNLTNLVNLLENVVERSEALNDEYTARMNNTIVFMHFSTCVCLVLALSGLISLILFVFKHVVRPLVTITEQARPLQQGNLALSMSYHSDNELGDLVHTLEESVGRIQEYVTDIDRVMGELAKGNFNVTTSARYIGDFQPIEEALGRFTASISEAMGGIVQAEGHVASYAEQLSSGRRLWHREQRTRRVRWKSFMLPWMSFLRAQPRT